VDEDDATARDEDEIGRARKVATMKAESVSESMRETADDELGPSVLPADERHARAPLGRRERVHAVGWFSAVVRWDTTRGDK
jgi:hypothetical protein